MLPLDHSFSSARKHCLRDRLRHRPLLEILEDRLPPGDTVLGLWATTSLLGLDFQDRHDFSTSAVRRAMLAWAATSATVAEVADLSLAAPGEDLSSRRPNTNSARETTDPCEGLSAIDIDHETAPGWRMQIRQAPLSFQGSDAGHGVVSSPIRAAQNSTVRTMDPASIPAGLAAVVAPQTDTLGANADRKVGYGTPFFFEKNLGQADAGFDSWPAGPPTHWG